MPTAVSRSCVVLPFTTVGLSSVERRDDLEPFDGRVSLSAFDFSSFEVKKHICDVSRSLNLDSIEGWGTKKGQIAPLDLIFGTPHAVADFSISKRLRLLGVFPPPQPLQRSIFNSVKTTTCPNCSKIMTIALWLYTITTMYHNIKFD